MTDRTNGIDTDYRAEQAEVVILDDQTEQEIGVASTISPPITVVGDLVSLANFQTEGHGHSEANIIRNDDNISFRVDDRAVHYEMSNPYDADGDGKPANLSSCAVIS